jgi:hypothetical protein
MKSCIFSSHEQILTSYDFILPLADSTTSSQDFYIMILVKNAFYFLCLKRNPTVHYLSKWIEMSKDLQH